MPAVLYDQLAEQVNEALTLLEALPPLPPGERKPRYQIKRAGLILASVIQGLQGDVEGEDEEPAPYPLPESAIR
jgi:hypothetical protein